MSLQDTQGPHFDPNSWGTYVAQLLGAGSVGLLLREIVKQLFARAKDEDANQTTRRGELMAQIETLTRRVDLLTERLDKAREREALLAETNVLLRAENQGLRDRHHRFRNYTGQLALSLDAYADKLGIPEHERPRIPTWIDETIPGPTARVVQERIDIEDGPPA